MKLFEIPVRFHFVLFWNNIM